MHLFSTIVAIVLASTASALSRTLYFTNDPVGVQVGHPVPIHYTAPAMSQPVKIVLRKGNMRDLTTIATLTDAATGGSYTWIPSSSLAYADDYALEIMQDGQINYSAEFSISGGGAGSPSSPLSKSKVPASASSNVVTKSIMPMTIPSRNMTTPTMTSAPSSMATIPLSRNGTFVTPTPSVAPSGPAGSTPGGTGTPGSQGSAGNVVKGSLTLMIGAFAALAYLG